MREKESFGTENFFLNSNKVCIADITCRVLGNETGILRRVKSKGRSACLKGEGKGASGRLGGVNLDADLI